MKDLIIVCVFVIAIVVMAILLQGCACIGTISNGTNDDTVATLKAVKSPKDDANK